MAVEILSSYSKNGTKLNAEQNGLALPSPLGVGILDPQNTISCSAFSVMVGEQSTFSAEKVLAKLLISPLVGFLPLLGVGRRHLNQFGVCHGGRAVGLIQIKVKETLSTKKIK